MLLLCAAYVFGCAFRSFLPRADVQRICLFDTWWSSVVVGRTVATIAEVAFAAQWAMILHRLGSMTGADTTLIAAWAIVPLIVVAEVLLLACGADAKLPAQRASRIRSGRSPSSSPASACARCCRSSTACFASS